MNKDFFKGLAVGVGIAGLAAVAATAAVKALKCCCCGCDDDFEYECCCGDCDDCLDYMDAPVGESADEEDEASDDTDGE